MLISCREEELGFRAERKLPGEARPGKNRTGKQQSDGAVVSLFFADVLCMLISSIYLFIYLFIIIIIIIK
jgi:hypothetical protein